MKALINIALATSATLLLASLVAEHFFNVSGMDFFQSALWPLMLASLCLRAYSSYRNGKNQEVQNG